MPAKLSKTSLRILLPVLLVIGGARATGGEQDSALAELNALLKDIQTLAASVSQIIVESDGGILEESSIQMYLHRPDGFYWETLEPFPELVVTNGELLWNYQPDLEQVVIEDWDRSRSELAAQLLNGQTEELAQDYRIEAVDGVADVEEFLLVPRAADSLYSRLSISFSAGELELIHLVQRNGEQTLWRFSGVRRNPDLADDLFNFTVPDGIEVIRNDYVD